jgi:amino acid permease
VTICLGASTITIPYVYYELGFVFGSFSILFGGAICMFTSQLITHCSELLKVQSFEQIAMASFGSKTQRLTSICMILCNGGFVVSYMVLVRLRLFYMFAVQIFHAHNIVENGGPTIAKLV